MGKKYADISIRDVTTPAFVNNELRIIVLITQEAYEKQDPPFLNRFEKFIFSSEYLLNEEQKKVTNEFMKIKNIFKSCEELKINPLHELINFNKEEINSIIFDFSLEKNKYLDYILSKLSRTFPQELIAFLNSFMNKNSYKFIINKIKEYYSKTVHSNLENYLKKITNSKHIIYTFTSILKNQIKFKEKKIENKTFGEIKKEDIAQILAKNIKSERQLEEKLIDFYSNKHKIIMVHFEDNFDIDHLEYILFTIERIEKEKKENKKIFLMIIHLKRSIPFRESYVTNLSSYEQIFIDNINGKHEEITDLIKKSLIELFNTSLINIEKQFSKKIYPVYTYIDYSFGDKLINSKEYIDNNINILQNIKN